MNAKELGERIGSIASLRVESFEMAVNVLDAKQAYGNTRYLVTPRNGGGQAWVDSSRLSQWEMGE